MPEEYLVDAAKSIANLPQALHAPGDIGELLARRNERIFSTVMFSLSIIDKPDCEMNANEERTALFL